MNVLMLNQSDTGGGAAIAVRRLQTGLGTLDVDARMLVRRHDHEGEGIIQTPMWASSFVARTRFALDKIPQLRYRERDRIPFSLNWIPDGLQGRIARLRPDVINVHWIGHGYMHPATLGSFATPIVWTLHDVWPFTGGCHVNLECTRYEERCGVCPRLGSSRDDDLSRGAWRRKHRALKEQDVKVVTPSAWLAGCARRSTLLRHRPIVVIPNGVDLQRFRPVNREEARAALGLSRDKLLVLFAVASGRRVAHKGFDLLESALDILTATRDWRNRLELVLAGPFGSEGVVRSSLPKNLVGSIRDESKMAMLYAAADVTIVPSRQESQSQVAVESLASGTPVVAFNATGVPEVVDHKVDGYLATPFDPQDLARGIQWVLEEGDRRHRLSEQARSKAERRFDLADQAARYHALFREVLAAGKETQSA